MKKQRTTGAQAMMTEEIPHCVSCLQKETFHENCASIYKCWRKPVSDHSLFLHDPRKSEILTAQRSSIRTNILAPEHWSQLAVDILAQKYFRKAGVPQFDDEGTPILNAKKATPLLGGERDARQVFHRLAGCWTEWGNTHQYFDTPEDAHGLSR